MTKIALITGITGQDGSYLAELLLSKGYEVHGIKRRSSSFNTQRIDHIYVDPHYENCNFFLHYGDLTDTENITGIINKVKPDEIYNLGAQSHVQVSFESPIYTANVDALGTLRLLESIRLLKLENKIKFYQASSSELYGLVQEIPQNETTPFYPRSPYGVSKLFSYWICKNYREAYGIFACNGILFNHESPRRGETFVTRKITRGLSSICFGLEKTLFMGNINAMRDWGHAKDYVEMQWLMLQKDQPKDYVISSGKQYSVRDFIIKAASFFEIEIEFRGVGKNEIGFVSSVNNHIAPKIKVGDEIIKIDPEYYRPSEVDSLLGDSSLAMKELGWKTKISIEDMINEMCDFDYKNAKYEYDRKYSS